MPAQLPFHFGPALRPISHGNPAGSGNPLFHRTARVFGQAAPWISDSSSPSLIEPWMSGGGTAQAAAPRASARRSNRAGSVQNSALP